MQENGKIVVGTKIDTKGIDEGLKEIDKKVTSHDVSQSFNKGLGKVKGVIKGLASSITGIFSKGLSVVGGVVKGIIGTIGSILTVVKLTIASIGKAMLKITLASMGMSATLGVVGLVAGILVKAFKKVGEENKELISNIKYLVYVIGEALAPVSNAVANMISQSIKNIINLLAKVITYVAYIINAWFGINILANVSKDAFMAMQKSTDGTADNIGKASKNAKDLKKQLAGFDEMNILQDNNANGGGAGDIGGIGGSNMPMPTVELGGEMPWWIDWIAKNKDLVISALAGITAGLVAMKLLGLDPIMSLGIGLAIAGVTWAIINLIKFLKDPTFENFIGILEGVTVAIIGVSLAFGMWPVALIGALALIVIEIVKHFNQIKKWFEDIIKWIDTKVRKKLIDMFGPLFGNVLTEFILYFVNIAKGAFESFYGGVKKVIDGVVMLFRGDFWNGIVTIFGGLKDVLLAPINAFIAGINSMIRGLNKVKLDIPSWVPGLGGKRLAFNIPLLPRLAKGTILNNPGQGVPVAGGRAIAGEAGREAYLPLSDSQLLEELGSTIGKYITVNLTNVTDIDGRTIARKVTEINNNNDFLLNR